jgi:hypothetical protein
MGLAWSADVLPRVTRTLHFISEDFVLCITSTMLHRNDIWHCEFDAQQSQARKKCYHESNINASIRHQCWPIAAANTGIEFMRHEVFIFLSHFLVSLVRRLQFRATSACTVYVSTGGERKPIQQGCIPMASCGTQDPYHETYAAISCIAVVHSNTSGPN